MPFQSEAQRRFMWANHPKIAEKWAHAVPEPETPAKAQEPQAPAQQEAKVGAAPPAPQETKVGGEPTPPSPKPTEPPPTTAGPPADVGPGMGGAIPSEFEPKGGTATGIKNATVDQERATRGLPPAMQPARRDFGEVWDRAMAILDHDPAYVVGDGTHKGLLDELRSKPRALTDTEDALLLHHQLDLQNEYNKATRDAAQAFDDGRMDDLEREKLRVAGLSDQLLDVYNIGKKVGTETGRGLAARRMMVNEDFTLAQMDLSMRAAKNGAPLTDSERTQIQDLHEKINTTQKAYDEYRANMQDKLARAEADRLLAEERANAPAFDKRILNQAESIVKRMEDFAKPAADRLRERLSRMSAGVDPTIVSDAAIVGSAKIARLGLDLAKFTDEMIREFGEKLRPMMADIWRESNKLIDQATDKVSEPVRRAIKKADLPAVKEAVVESIKDKIAKGKKDEITWYVQKLSRSLVQSGITDREALIDAVHSTLQDAIPGITRRETMDAISGYGDFKQLSKDQISVRLRGMKGEMQQIAKLEDIESRKPPLKSGVERRAPTDEERRLLAQVEEAKRKYGVVVTDPETQLKSALESRKTYYRNQITDLEKQIASKEKFVPERTPPPTDPELEALKKRRDDLKKDFDEVFGKPGVTAEQYARMLDRDKANLEKSIAEKERKLKEGDVSTDSNQPVNRPAHPEIEVLKQRRDELNREIAEMRNPKKTDLEKLKARLQRQIDDYHDRLTRRDFAARPKRSIDMDPEASALKAQNERVKKQFQREVAKERLRNAGPVERGTNWITKWRRGFILSGPVTLAKLTSAALERMTFTPIEEAIGAVIGKLIPDVAKRAPREGGFNSKAEARALVIGWTRGNAGCMASAQDWSKRPRRAVRRRIPDPTKFT